MKNSIFKIFIISLLAFSSISCEDFFEVNVDPNSPVAENLDLNAKLPAALVASANYQATTLNQIGGFWGGYWGTSNEGVSAFTSLKIYNGPAIRDTRDGIPVWENTYNNLLFYKQILDQANQEDAKFYTGIAKIMTAYHYFILVDFYNNVPFDDALQGSAVLHPRYESGKVVYEKSISLINEGIEEIKVASLLPTTDDVLFKGDKLKWFRFANTLKLRALLAQSEVEGQSAYIATEINKIRQEGSGFITENASINPGYLNTAGKMNPFYENYYRNNTGVAVGNQANIRPTEYLINFYKNRNDPRLAQNYVAIDGEYKGVVFGDNTIKDDWAANKTSALKGPVENQNQPAGIIKSFNQPVVLISLAEANFLEAEAIVRGWWNGTAQALYNNAVQASFNYLFNVNNYDVTTYLAQSNVDFNTAPNKIERIITQKWLALNGVNQIVAWNDFRRLGLPNFPNSVTSPNPTAYPLRFMYPETEINHNNENATSQGDVGVLTARVWWDID